MRPVQRLKGQRPHALRNYLQRNSDGNWTHRITGCACRTTPGAYPTNQDACGVGCPDKPVAVAGLGLSPWQSVHRSTVRPISPDLAESGSGTDKAVASCRSKGSVLPLAGFPLVAIRQGSRGCGPCFRIHMRRDGVPFQTPARHTGCLAGDFVAWSGHAVPQISWSVCPTIFRSAKSKSIWHKGSVSV